MDVIRGAPAPVFGTKDVKFYYLTQTGQVPPSFIAFANEPRGVTPAYRRFISKRLAEAFDLQGVPLRSFVMKKRRSERKGSALDSENQLEQLEDLAMSYEIGGAVLIITSLFLSVLILVLSNKRVFKFLTDKFSGIKFLEKHIKKFHNIHESFWIMLSFRNLLFMTAISFVLFQERPALSRSVIFMGTSKVSTHC